MEERTDPAVTVGESRRTIDYLAGILGRAGPHDGRRNHLVVADAGGGKTHALTAIGVGVRRRRPGALLLRPHLLGIGGYADLLDELLRCNNPALASHEERSGSNWMASENLLADMVAAQPTVLILDDLDRAFSRMESVTPGRLRGWVDRTANVEILASATNTRKPASRSRRPWPWVTMFDVATLEPLQIDDAMDLVLAVGRQASPNAHDGHRRFRQRQQIAELHAVLGGNPRVWAITAAHLARTEHIDAPLPAILDQLAPYYLPRLHGLSPLSSRLVITLARSPAPISVTQLAQSVGLSHQNTAAALSRLAFTRWVIPLDPPAGTDQRKRLYTLHEPSMREFLLDRDVQQRI